MWLLDEWQPLAADKMEGLGKKGWEIKRSKGGGKRRGGGVKACVTDDLSAAKLLGSMRVSHNQTNGYLAAKTAGWGEKKKREERRYSSAVERWRGEKFCFWRERERDREKRSHGEKHQVFTQHESTRETVLNTSTHGYETEEEDTARGWKRQKKTKQRQINRACGQKPPCQRWYLFWALFFQFGGMNYSWRRSV